MKKYERCIKKLEKGVWKSLKKFNIDDDSYSY